MTVRILIEAVLLLGLLWIWSFYYERSFDQSDDAKPRDERD
ncbi:MAG: hypothetical protein O2968_19645 [Acidobacteria bacterium]|nr:hypothetical protein [Acidobacteriota bacterium]